MSTLRPGIWLGRAFTVPPRAQNSLDMIYDIYCILYIGVYNQGERLWRESVSECGHFVWSRVGWDRISLVDNSVSDRPLHQVLTALLNSGGTAEGGQVIVVLLGEGKALYPPPFHRGLLGTSGPPPPPIPSLSMNHSGQSSYYRCCCLHCRGGLAQALAGPV